MAPTKFRSVLTRALRAAALVPAALLVAAQPSQATYLVGQGDVLEIDVAGIPEMKARSAVGADGEVSVPLIGQVVVAGQSITEVRGKIQALLPTREFRRRTNDGREFPVILSPSEINVSIFEYRPVYLSGDVAKPGAHPFRPGLTARQAVALAGGFDILRFKMDNPFLQLSDLRDTYNAAWIDYAREQHRLARLRAELDGKQEIDRKALVPGPLAPSLEDELARNELALLKAKGSDVVKEKAYLVRAAGQEAQRAQILTEQEKRENEGVQSDNEELKRNQELFSRGSVPTLRVTEARRSVLLSSTRALQTTAFLASVEREKGDLERRLQKVDDGRRLELLREVQEATARLATIRSRLEAASEKLRYTGMVKSQLVRGSDSQPSLAVFRQSGAGTQRVAATLDTELQPGDVVEIALQAEAPLDTPTR